MVEVAAARRDIDHDVPRPRHGIGNRLDPQHIRTTGFAYHNRSHAAHAPLGRACAGAAPLKRTLEDYSDRSPQTSNSPQRQPARLDGARLCSPTTVTSPSRSSTYTAHRVSEGNDCWRRDRLEIL